MNVLFVSSGNSEFQISPILKNQGDSLERERVNVQYFLIREKGVFGYVKYAFKLRKFLKENDFDVVHAHYIFSGITAALAGSNPLILSLMGSDIYSSRLVRGLTRLLNQFWFQTIIVKSSKMKDLLGLKKAVVLPNGINLIKFKELNKKDCQARLGWMNSKRHILFAANPNKWVKNFDLTKRSVDLCNDPLIELHALENVPNDEIPNYMNASDVVVLSSRWEGSPNVIKEASACGRPIVSTRVGDVEDVIGEVEGCFVVEDDPIDMSVAIKKALDFNGSTAGRKKVEHLDERIVAGKLIDIYKHHLRDGN